MAKSSNEKISGINMRSPVSIGTYLNRLKNKMRMMLTTMKNRYAPTLPV
jgi:hypothetical protein